MKNAAISVMMLLLFATAAFAQKKDLSVIFPKVSELHGGAEHWMSNILQVEQKTFEQKNDDKTKIKYSSYSATYAYFATTAKPLFDIPRSNVYSVNVTFNVCDSVSDALKLYAELTAGGEAKQKKIIALGDKGMLYVEPNPKNELMGQYFLTSLNRYVVMQIHADDGFVLMDMGTMMNMRLTEYLSAGSKDISNAVTLKVEKTGYDAALAAITVNSADAKRAKITGILYDQNSKKVADARITVLETGAKFKTNSKGEFSSTVGATDGKEVTVFRALTINKNPVEHGIASGYYAADISYKTGSTIGQDHWRISVEDGGKIFGSSYSIKNSAVLSFTGKVADGEIIIDRPCGGSGVTRCHQSFKAFLTDTDVVEGTWTGTGGGGEWRLYKNIFTEKNIAATPAEAKFNISGTKSKTVTDGFTVVSGKTPMILTPTTDGNSDFYLKSARLRVMISSKSKAVTELMLSNDDGTDLAISPEISLPKQTETFLDVSRIYKTKLYNKYLLNFPSFTDITAELTPTFELVYAVAGAKILADGAVEAGAPQMNGKDLIGTTKTVKPNGSTDIVIPLHIKAYGTTLKGVELFTLGKDRRQWNTYADNIAPGVAVVDGDGTVINNDQGRVFYPVQKFDEKLSLYIDKGSVSDPEGFQLILNFDDIKVEYELILKK